MKHKYADVIKAAADGATVQYLHKVPRTGIWVDWVAPEFPPFTEHYEWRIKPETLRYRVALFQGEVINAITSANDAEEVETYPHFVRWLHDWQEVEI